MRRRTAIVAIALAGVAAGTLAQAQAASDKARSAQQQDARQGIENARAAGIEVDPAVEDMMARAPIGSCANDPSQAKCPDIHAVVRSGTPAADGSVEYAPAAPAG